MPCDKRRALLHFLLCKGVCDATYCTDGQKDSSGYCKRTLVISNPEQTQHNYNKLYPSQYKSSKSPLSLALNTFPTKKAI